MEQNLGWANDERMDGIKRKYVKWILDRRIPNYILVEERIKTGSYEKGCQV